MCSQTSKCKVHSETENHCETADAVVTIECMGVTPPSLINSLPDSKSGPSLKFVRAIYNDVPYSGKIWRALNLAKWLKTARF